MFEQIPWSSYLTLILITTTVYYGCIGWVFYRHRLLSLVAVTKNTDRESSLLPQAHQLLEEIRELADSPVEEEALMRQVKLRLQKYPALLHSSFQQPINEFLLRQWPQFSPVEIEQLWKQ